MLCMSTNPLDLIKQPNIVGCRNQKNAILNEFIPLAY